MNTKELTIEPIANGEFQYVFPDGETWNCTDIDDVGAQMEAATLDALKPALAARKKIKITIEYE
jgi:hypothetical protein